MKSVFNNICLLVTTSVFAQKIEWKEMHDFHTVISKTFHPAEENKLQPKRDSAAIILKRAKLWRQIFFPLGYDAVAVRPVLEHLTVSCRALLQVVQKKGNRPAIETAYHKSSQSFS
jgi:hypothetical protein